MAPKGHDVHTLTCILGRKPRGTGAVVRAFHWVYAREAGWRMYRGAKSVASVDFRGLRAKKVWPRRSRGGGGGDATDCAGVGFGAFRAGGFLPVEAAGGYETVAGAYFRGRKACAQYDLKVIVGAETLDPKGDAYHGCPRSHNT